MEKYTIQQIKDQRISIIIDNEEQFNKLKSYLGEDYKDFEHYNDYKYYRIYENGEDNLFGHMDSSYLDTWISNLKSTKEIHFDQINFEDFVLPEKWCVKPINEYQLKLLGEYFDKTLPISRNPNFYKNLSNTYTNIYLGYSGCNGNVIHNGPSQGYTEITFEQFQKYVLKQENNMIDYTIKGTKLPMIPRGIKFRCGFWKPGNSHNAFCQNYHNFISHGSTIFNNEICIYAEKPDFRNINSCFMIKLSDIQNLTNNNMENKKIIGYKLIDQKYAKAACKIVEISNFTIEEEIDFSVDSYCYDKFKEIGLLDLWFKPVYQTIDKIEEVKMNDNFYLKVNITTKQVFHSNENITAFVKEVVEHFSISRFAGYGLDIKDLVFSKTGCQNKETTLAQWIDIYEMIK